MGAHARGWGVPGMMAGGGAVADIVNDKRGAIAISIILGLGLAAIFRATCVGDGCVVIHAPPRSETDRRLYRIDDQCYKYTPYPVGCPDGRAPQPTPDPQP